MESQTSNWLDEFGDYISGGLTALLCLDLGLFFIHLMLERSTEGYSLSTLPFIIVALALFHIERVYRKQAAAEH
ncbi:hypothetical protein [Alkalimarinus sediminis]|uniref:Uncharacterized protein n=1 Tax=Alkalimarinus sediminis TaxID=1632866 RepID=A0A9E8HSV4_9ALTE|nr:hypothetical protein [Alkalimarinus sediminis]UZW75149.1 hypothetical protein NNL22_00650 [Alkalimarinus sediminis]